MTDHHSLGASLGGGAWTLLEKGPFLLLVSIGKVLIQLGKHPFTWKSAIQLVKGLFNSFRATKIGICGTPMLYINEFSSK
jgi:hypothetical protein